MLSSLLFSLHILLHSFACSLCLVLFSCVSFRIIICFILVLFYISLWHFCLHYAFVLFSTFFSILPLPSVPAAIFCSICLQFLPFLQCFLNVYQLRPHNFFACLLEADSISLVSFFFVVFYITLEFAVLFSCLSRSASCHHTVLCVFALVKFCSPYSRCQSVNTFLVINFINFHNLVDVKELVVFEKSGRFVLST